MALEPYLEKLAVRKTVTLSWLMVLSVFGKKVALNGVYGRDAQPKDYEFAKGLFKITQKLLDKGEITPHPVKLMRGGWEGIMKGVDIIRNQDLSGQKLVYRVV